jgi:lipid-A-disaccharide synthase
LKPNLTVMIVTGEASGDDRGAALARALRARLGDGVRFVGVGGDRLAAEGVVSPFDISELSILGLLEGLLAYPRVIRRVADTVALALREAPDVVILIDSWGFTLRVAQHLRRVRPGLLLIKYVGPQVWASRPGRAKTLARTVDHLLSIHAFEGAAFEAAGLPVTFVGNAALAFDVSTASAQRFRRRIGAVHDEPILLVLPGSRPSEISHVMPPFEAAAGRLQALRPDLRVVVVAAPTVASQVKARVAAWPSPAYIIEDEAEKVDGMRAATVALACSGTVATELAVAGVPMVVGYRVGRVTYAILKRLLRTKYVTLFNIAAQGFVAPELLQDDCTGERLAREVAQRLDDPALRAQQTAAQFAALDLMGRGGPDPSDAAAAAVLSVLEGRRS